MKYFIEKHPDKMDSIGNMAADSFLQKSWRSLIIYYILDQTEKLSQSDNMLSDTQNIAILSTKTTMAVRQ